jgi:localization factor PodJL
MAPEPSWQLSNAETKTGAGAPFSDQESIEGLLRRLIQRVEESERRYDEALGELHARLDRLSQTPEGSVSSGSREETETLERLREQLSGLARRLEPAPEPTPRAVSPLEQALSEFRAVSAGLAAAEPGLPRQPAADASAPALKPDLAPPPEPDRPASVDLPLADTEDFDRRLLDMARRLEHSIGGGASPGAIEKLNARMDEIAANFEAALQQSPKLESLHRLERQIADMERQLGRVEQHVAHIGVVEGQLQRLIGRLDQTPAQMEGLASRAASDAARLVAETALGKPSAAERLEAMHRDIVAMNERGQVTDDRMVDTLEAMHASLKGLAEQAERATAAPPEPEPARSPMAPAVRAAEAQSAEDERMRSLRDRLAASDPGPDGDGPQPPFGRAARAEPSASFDDVEPASLATRFAPETSFDSMEDLVAAARRAAEAAAARAEEDRGGSRHRRHRSALASESGEPERRKWSILVVIAALLLLVSAALLYTRLPSKPELDTPTATAPSMPAPAIGVAPAPPRLP